LTILDRRAGSRGSPSYRSPRRSRSVAPPESRVYVATLTLVLAPDALDVVVDTFPRYQYVALAVGEGWGPGLGVRCEMARSQASFFVTTSVGAALLVSSGAVHASDWFPSAGLDDPADLTATEFAKINALPTVSQAAAGRVVLSTGPERSATAPAGTIGIRGSGWRHVLYPALVGTWGDTRALTLDLQFNSSHFYPRDDLVVPARDWMLNLQLRLWTGSALAPGGGDRHGFYGGTAGVPILLGGSGNLFVRGLHDAARLWHDERGSHFQGNLLGGLLYASGDSVSFSIDGGVTSVFSGWRWPLQATLWVAFSRHVTLGFGGGVVDLRSTRTSSWGVALAFTY
jgi:hypothetical protein